MQNINNIESLIARAINYGRVEMMKVYAPETDKITRPKLLAYLKMNGFKPSDLQRWENNGLVSFTQTSRNSSRIYSFKEIERLLLTYGVSMVLDD